jgi:RNA polymerase sigma-70 factor (ECF subfamily)
VGDVRPEDAFDQYHRAVYSFAYRLTRREDTAEDITQECFLALIRQPARFNPNRGTMKTYLFSIARNLALKEYREERSELLEGEVAGSDPTASLPLSSAIAQAVATLPALQQEALILFEYEGFTLEEIAGIVQADIGTVKSRLHRARGCLRRTLAPYRGVKNGTV